MARVNQMMIMPFNVNAEESMHDSYYRISRHFAESSSYKQRAGRDHAPALSISDDMPEAGGGGESAAAPEVAASDDDDGDGDGDPDSDRRSRPRSKTSHPSFPPALLAFEPLSHYVSFGRSRIYQLIAAGEFPQPIKVGKSSRWVKADIDAWIRKQTTSQRVGA